MYIFKKYAILFILCLWFDVANSQYKTADSHIQRLPSLQEDTLKVEFLLTIVRAYYTNTDYSQTQTNLK